MPIPAFATIAHLLLAGMPSPELVFTELGRRRWEELSFFLFGFLLMAAIVRWLWNLLRKDFPALPQLSYRRSLSLMLLWGLAMTVVLALISGARELMTPGAWSPSGVTYKLTRDASEQGVQNVEDVVRDQQRRLRLENLRFALWQFAASHSGRFPTKEESDQIAKELWSADPESGTRFIYVDDETLQKSSGILVYEPELFDDRQYTLRISGEIAKRDEDKPVGSASPRSTTSAAVRPVSTQGPAKGNEATDSNGSVP